MMLMAVMWMAVSCLDVNFVLHQRHPGVNGGYVDGGFLSSVAFHVAVSCPVLHSMCVVAAAATPTSN